MKLYSLLGSVLIATNCFSNAQTVCNSNNIINKCPEWNFDHHQEMLNVHPKYNLEIKNIGHDTDNTYDITIRVYANENIALKYLHSLKIIGVQGPQGTIQLWGANEGVTPQDFVPSDFTSTFKIHANANDNPCNVELSSFQIQYEYDYSDEWVANGWGQTHFDLMVGCGGDNQGNSNFDFPAYVWPKDCDSSCGGDSSSSYFPISTSSETIPSRPSETTKTAPPEYATTNTSEAATTNPPESVTSYSSESVTSCPSESVTSYSSKSVHVTSYSSEYVTSYQSRFVTSYSSESASSYSSESVHVTSYPPESATTDPPESATTDPPKSVTSYSSESVTTDPPKSVTSYASESATSYPSESASPNSSGSVISVKSSTDKVSSTTATSFTVITKGCNSTSCKPDTTVYTTVGSFTISTYTTLCSVDSKEKHCPPYATTVGINTQFEGAACNVKGSMIMILISMLVVF